jgi:cytoskeletal protein CcmA (bactofilin family)
MALDAGKTLIDTDTSVDGRIEGQHATVAGRFKGEIKLKGQLIVAPTAHIVASVEAELAEVAGSIQGDLKVKKLVILETGRVAGKVDAAQLVVREGAVLNGPIAAGAAGPAPAASAGSGTPAVAPGPAALRP